MKHNLKDLQTYETYLDFQMRSNHTLLIKKKIQINNTCMFEQTNRK